MAVTFHGKACAEEARATRREQLRKWLEGAGGVNLPMWTSRQAWNLEVSVWARTTKLSRSMAVETLLAVARETSSYADHCSGRSVAVSRSRIAAAVGCCTRTVTTAWALLRESGLAVEIQRGHGSDTTPGVGCRPSVYYLVSRKVVNNFHLPRSGSLRSKRSSSSVRSYSKKRLWKEYPEQVRTMASQLAGVCAGFQGREGTVCAAIERSGLDTGVWTPKAVKTALDAEGMKWEIPKNRFAYLLFRLKRLPAEPPAPEQTPVPPRYVPSEKTPASAEHRQLMMNAIRKRWR